jgi:predicted dehydrogenase
MIRIGIAGIGFMGVTHFRAYRQLRGVKVVALASRNHKHLTGDWRDIQGNFGPPGEKVDLSGIHAYEHVDALIADDDIDLVDICLPTAMHADVAVQALRHGKHVFTEKPLALKLADCNRMVRAAARARRRLLVGHIVPFFPEYAWAIDTIRGGKYGKLLGGQFRRVIAFPKWLPNYWQADQTGGPMFDLHVHDAHLICLLFGMPSSVVTRGTMHEGVPKFWHTLFGFGDSNVVVQATCGVIDQQGRSFNQAFEIRLERATLMFEYAVIGGRGQYLCQPTLLEPNGKVTLPKLAGGDPSESFRAELRAAVASISGDRPSEVLGCEVARDAVRLCERQIASLRTGRIIRL